MVQHIVRDLVLREHGRKPDLREVPHGTIPALPAAGARAQQQDGGRKGRGQDGFTYSHLGPGPGKC